MKYGQLLADLDAAESNMRAAMEKFARTARDLRVYSSEVEGLSRKIGEENSELCDRIYKLEHPEGGR